MQLLVKCTLSSTKHGELATVQNILDVISIIVLQQSWENEMKEMPARIDWPVVLAG